jgi:hypothetical protein
MQYSFNEWVKIRENQSRKGRWERRKSQKDQKTQKQGYVAGNPRYGKKGTGLTQGHPDKHRDKDMHENHPGNAAYFGGAPAPEPQESPDAQMYQYQNIANLILRAVEKATGTRQYAGVLTGEALLRWIDQETLSQALQLGILETSPEGHLQLGSAMA